MKTHLSRVVGAGGELPGARGDGAEQRRHLVHDTQRLHTQTVKERKDSMRQSQGLIGITGGMSVSCSTLLPSAMQGQGPISLAVRMKSVPACPS